MSVQYRAYVQGGFWKHRGVGWNKLRRRATYESRGAALQVVRVANHRWRVRAVIRHDRSQHDSTECDVCEISKIFFIWSQENVVLRSNVFTFITDYCTHTLASSGFQFWQLGTLQLYSTKDTQIVLQFCWLHSKMHSKGRKRDTKDPRLSRL